MDKRYLFFLSLLLSLKSIALVFAILNGGIGLGPDEAQYWTWSQSLDWGYYSKPPGIAWEIALGTSLFGNKELGVRFMPLVIGSFLPFLVYCMARRCLLSPAASFWTAVCMAFCPIGILASFLAITDGGMVLFWTASCAYLAGKIEQKERPNYFLVGFFICLGALFKWPIYSLWIFILGCWIFLPYFRAWNILWGLVLSLLALLPTVYWNATHEWATFRHVLATLAGGHAQLKPGGGLPGNPLEFLGAQVVLVSPILFLLLVMAWKRLIKREGYPPASVLFCGVVSLVPVAVGFLMAFFMKVQGNWAIFAYPSAFVVLSWFAVDGTAWKMKWLNLETAVQDNKVMQDFESESFPMGADHSQKVKAAPIGSDYGSIDSVNLLSSTAVFRLKGGVALSVVVCAAVFCLPYIQSHHLASGFPIPYKVNPFRHNVGWEELGPALKQAGYDPDKDFLFGDKYQTASILSFYGPEQKRAYFFNLQGSRKNQFSYWPGMEQEQKGERGFFTVIENIPQLDNPELPQKYLDALASYFKSVRFIGTKPLFQAYGKTVKGVLLFECEGYNGLAPKETDLY